MIQATIRLREGREKTVRQRHPWIFSGAVEEVDGDPEAGQVVRIVSPSGVFLGWGHYSPVSQIRVRVLSWDENEAIDDGWWRRRLEDAVARRQGFPEREGADACRLVYAEADLLPGLVVDRYGDWLVLQAMTAGVERAKETIVSELSRILGPSGIYERSDAEVRKLEGLALVSGVLWGEAPPERIGLREDGFRFLADVREGQKTGFYLDQRSNRRTVARYAAGRRVLDVFAYTGAFSVHCAGRGASALALVDSSGAALRAAADNLRVNGADSLDCEMIEGDAFSVLRAFRDEGRTFDLVVLDPPRLAPTRALAPKASRAYKDINLLGMKLLVPGGILATFSCSGGIDWTLFREILAWAALDAGREVQILERLGQAPDHPTLLSFPESEYLKGFICRVR